MLPGNTDSAEIRGLEGGVSYSVRVTALVGDREGAPVSIVVTTRRRSLGWGKPCIGGLNGWGAGFGPCGGGSEEIKPGIGRGAVCGGACRAGLGLVQETVGAEPP